MAKKAAPKKTEEKPVLPAPVPGIHFHKVQHPLRGIKFDLPKGE